MWSGPQAEPSLSDTESVTLHQHSNLVPRTQMLPWAMKLFMALFKDKHSIVVCKADVPKKVQGWQHYHPLLYR